MTMIKSEIKTASIILLSFILGLYLYPQMPEKMASHWNLQGQVDGYMSKFWGLFLIPLISVGLFLLFILIPKIDPLKANIEKFRKYYDRFVVLVIGFLFYIYILTIFWIFWNSGMRLDMIRFLAPAFGILFYYSGILTENSKRNWFIGIRTPWTMSSEKVWEKTNRMGGKLFKISGLVALLGIFLPSYALFFILVPVIFAVAYTIIYSYFEYQKRG